VDLCRCSAASCSLVPLKVKCLITRLICLLDNYIFYQIKNQPYSIESCEEKCDKQIFAMRPRRKESSETTPTCSCRVLYLGSAVPQVTKDGLQGIQEPLRELYPSEGAVQAKGIDSWLSVWSNGLLLENVDENQKKVSRFFPIETLHYCASVRYVKVQSDESSQPRFMPLDSPFSDSANPNHPPLFACIMRRTTGIKVLECHVFICKNKTPANALVRCCFHAFHDTAAVLKLEKGMKPEDDAPPPDRDTEEKAIEIDYTCDLSSVNSEIIPGMLSDSPTLDDTSPEPGDESFTGNENHKVWNGKPAQEDIYGSPQEYGTVRSSASAASIYGTSSSARNRRPRQMVAQSDAPPPPPSESGDSVRGRAKSRSRRDEDEISRITAEDMHRTYNGSLHRPTNGHPSSKKGKIPKIFSSLADRKSKQHPRGSGPFMMGPPPRGTMGRPPPHMMPMPGPYPPHMGPPGPPPPMMMPPPPHMGPPGPFMGPPGPPMGRLPPPHMSPPHMGPPMGHPMGPPMGPHGPPPPHMLPPPPHAYNSMPRRSHSRAVEEPIYMPSSRPLSPTASYQPGHFPHERYMMQQHASSARNHYPTGGKKHKKKSKDQHLPPEEIYGRRGHMNEKAFAQSIRAEQRARSFSSLAGVGVDMNNKDREIMQMVHDLDLSGDEIERAEPPHAAYRPLSATLASRHSRTSRR